MIDSLQAVQTVQIGTEFYRLVEVQGEFPRLAWEETFEDENAYQGGTPNILSDPASTWHLGAFKSREGIPGTSEYGAGTDARWPNRLLPGPNTNLITLPDCAVQPTSFFEALGYLWVVAGRYIYRINPADDTKVKSKDLGANSNGIMGLSWEGDTGLVTVTTSAPTDRSLWEVTAIGSPDTWAQAAAGVKPRIIAKGLDRLYMTEETGLLRNCLTGKDPLVSANWSDEVQCGSPAEIPNSLVAYMDTVLNGKPDGLFGVNIEGKGESLLSRMAPNANNCLGMYVVEPFVLVPHGGGTFRFMPGLVQSAGMEQELLNDSGIRGRLRAFIDNGVWTLALLTDGTTTYILAGRDAKEGEPSLGPIIWDTLAYIPVPSAAIHVSYLWDPPRVFYGYGTVGVGYYKLSGDYGISDPDGADYRFTMTGTRFTRRYSFGIWRDKDFPRVDLVVKDTISARYWVVAYDIDRAGSWSDLDINGDQMKADSDGLHTFYLPLTARGREIQYRFTYTGNAINLKAEIIHFKPYAVPASLKLRHYSLILYLAGETRHDGGVEQRPGIDQLNDLYALTESSAAVDCKGPWGDITVHPKRVRTLEVRQEGHESPRFLVELVVQKRKVS